MSAYSDAQVREIEREREAWKRAAIALSRRVWACASCRAVDLDASGGSCPQCGQRTQEYDGATLIARWNTEDGMRAAAAVARLPRAQVARLRKALDEESCSELRCPCVLREKIRALLAEPAPEGQR